jgi:hypothetical protein
MESPPKLPDTVPRGNIPCGKVYMGFSEIQCSAAAMQWSRLFDPIAVLTVLGAGNRAASARAERPVGIAVGRSRTLERFFPSVKSYPPGAQEVQVHCEYALEQQLSRFVADGGK